MFIVAMTTMSCNSLGNYGNGGFVPLFNFAFVTNPYQTSDMAYMTTNEIGPNGYPLAECYPGTNDVSGQYRWHNIETARGTVEASIANMNTLHGISASESEYQFTSMIRNLVRAGSTTEYERYLNSEVLIVTYLPSPTAIAGTQYSTTTNEIGGIRIYNLTGTFQRKKVRDLYRYN